jgi:hypothetical protein
VITANPNKLGCATKEAPHWFRGATAPRGCFAQHLQTKRVHDKVCKQLTSLLGLELSRLHLDLLSMSTSFGTGAALILNLLCRVCPVL